MIIWKESTPQHYESVDPPEPIKGHNGYYPLHQSQYEELKKRGNGGQCVPLNLTLDQWREADWRNRMVCMYVCSVCMYVFISQQCHQDL